MSTVNPKPLSQARDADARHTVAALQRAAEKAKLLAAQTQTPLIVVSHGEIRDTAPSSPFMQAKLALSEQTTG